MRNLWAGILPVALVLGSPTAFNAARESKEPTTKVLTSEITYVGPLLENQALEQRARSTARSIDIYNTWTSFQKVDLMNNFNMTGHSYVICQDRHPRIVFGSFVFALDSPITVEVEHKITLNGAVKNVFKCSVDLTAIGPWLLTCETDPREIQAACVGRGSPCYYKLTSIHKVTRGGTGNIRETAWFDLWDICP